MGKRASNLKCSRAKGRWGKPMANPRTYSHLLYSWVNDEREGGWVRKVGMVNENCEDRRSMGMMLGKG